MTKEPHRSCSPTYDATNRLTQKDGVAYTYDGHGQLTGDGVSTYVWNARHQLTAISGPDTLGFGYDGLGRRRSLTVNGRTTVTLYDGWNPIQLQEHGVAVENRLMGLGLDALYARVRDGQVESYLTDALGSVLELRDAAQARIVSYTYDPYGGTQASGTSSNTVKYTGREEDLGDLYYYRHRYYKPSIGRFLSEDPIGLTGGENLYVYVENSPVNWIDPLGLAPPGHHYIPQAVYKSYPLPSETKSIFDKATTGPVEHYFDKGHRRYNDAARQFFEDFLKKNRIDPSKMTPEQAKQCLDEFKKSQNPSIKDYLEFLKRGGGRFKTPLFACPACEVLKYQWQNPDFCD